MLTTLRELILTAPCPPGQICQDKPQLPGILNEIVTNWPLALGCGIVALVLIGAYKHMPKYVIAFAVLLIAAFIFAVI